MSIQFTKEQRLQLYQRTAIEFKLGYSRLTRAGLCEILNNIAIKLGFLKTPNTNDYIPLLENPNTLPELSKHKPDPLTVERLNGYWFPLTELGYKTRVDILKQAIEELE